MPQSVAFAMSTTSTMQRIEMMIMAYSNFLTCVWSGGNSICLLRATATPYDSDLLMDGLGDAFPE